MRLVFFNCAPQFACSAGRADVLESLLKYSVSTFYPDISNDKQYKTDQQRYLAMFEEIVRRLTVSFFADDVALIMGAELRGLLPIGKRLDGVMVSLTQII